MLLYFGTYLETMKSEYIVLRDTREKNGWDFSSHERCKAVKDWGLKTGDYTVKGLETSLVIERKASTGEIAMNLGQKKKAFEAEMERMSEFRWAYIVCEFSIDDIMSFPENSGIPRKKWQYIRMNGKFIWKRIRELEEEHGVVFLFCNNKHDAESRVMRIFDEVTEILIREQHS